MSQPAIAVRGLSKRYGDQYAVKDLDLEVHPGEVLGLLGPNGAGKTTTIECMVGLRQADAGEIELLGLKQGADALRIKSRIGVQLQATGLLGRQTVRETMALFASFFPRAASTEGLLERVGLTDKAQARCASLSGGQKQRLTLALALINEPDLLFLDEPTSAMDPQARRVIWDLLQELKGRGASMLLTTHSMEEAAQLCDRVAIIDHGRIMALGKPTELIRAHFSETAIELAPPTDVSPEVFKTLPGVTRLMADQELTTLYTSDVPLTVTALVQRAQEERFELQRFTVRYPSLEDLFLLLTGRALRH